MMKKVLKKVLKKIAEFYHVLDKKRDHFLHKVILNEKIIEHEKSMFYKKYKVEPTEREVNFIKKEIVKRKILEIYALIIFAIFMIYLSINQ